MHGQFSELAFVDRVRKVVARDECEFAARIEFRIFPGAPIAVRPDLQVIRDLVEPAIIRHRFIAAIGITKHGPARGEGLQVEEERLIHRPPSVRGIFTQAEGVGDIRGVATTRPPAFPVERAELLGALLVE